MKNKHERPRARAIAEGNTILRTQVGSGLHGVAIEGTDDRDEMAVCLEPPECVIGLEKFEQYQFRTQPEGVRSGPSDVDYVNYSLRKWSRLAAQGNPTVLLLLFAPEREIVEINQWGRKLQTDKDLFLSREAGRRFIGYLDAQRDRMLGLRSQRTNRPELIEVYGFDTKFATHAIRLGLQGVELLQTGSITLPIPEPDRTWLRELRIGKYTKQEALDRIAHHRGELETLLEKSELPERPDYAALNNWLMSMYQSWWAGHAAP